VHQLVVLEENWHRHHKHARVYKKLSERRESYQLRARRLGCLLSSQDSGCAAMRACRRRSSWERQGIGRDYGACSEVRYRTAELTHDRVVVKGAALLMLPAPW
jgi:hypothetical protein